jgi:S-disulfanyl-L-cysteine oxidoreductase SoxD
MGLLRIVPILLLLAGPALAQTYGIGKAPTAAQLAQDITISPTGEGLPVGHGVAAEGAKLYLDKGCVACHGPAGVGGVTVAPNLIGNKGTGPGDPAWKRVTGGEGNGALPILAPNAIIVWDYINRGMPLGSEGTLTPNEVYALTAYLMVLNKMIPEDKVLDQSNLAQIKMPIGTEWVRVPDWKPGGPRMPGYPY